MIGSVTAQNTNWMLKTKFSKLLSFHNKFKLDNLTFVTLQFYVKMIFNFLNTFEVLPLLFLTLIFISNLKQVQFMEARPYKNAFCFVIMGMCLLICFIRKLQKTS